MATFLLKTEPSTYSFADLERQRRATWDGIANAAALIHLRSIKRGDDLLIYHTGADKAVVGLARAASDAYEDPKHPGQTPDGSPMHAVIDVVPVKSAAAPLSLTAIKADKRFADFALVRISRLSVMPVPPVIDAAIRTLAGL